MSTTAVAGRLDKLTATELADLIKDPTKIHLCVPHCDVDEDGKLSSTTDERQRMQLSFQEGISGYGIDELGMEVREFFELVHAIGWRNSTSIVSKEIVSPLVVLESSLYDAMKKKKGTSPSEELEWVEYAVRDTTFFEAAEEIGRTSDVQLIFFAMMSQPGAIKMTHFHGCCLTFESNRKLSPIITVFGAEGDTHDRESTKLEQFSLPYPDEDKNSRPSAKHLSKVKVPDGNGVCDNIQSALSDCGWSSVVCSHYVLNLMVYVIMLRQGDLISAMEKRIVSFHRDFIAKLTKTVKNTTARYLYILAKASLKQPVKAISRNVSSLTCKEVDITGLNHKLMVKYKQGRSVKTKTKTRSFISLDNAKSGLYILGQGDIAEHNKKTLHSILKSQNRICEEDALSDLNNFTSFLEDHPGGKVIPNSEGQCEQSSEKPLSNLDTSTAANEVDNIIWRVASEYGFTYTIKTYCTRADTEDQYRVLFKGVLDHPMFGLLNVNASLLPKEKIEEFWAELAVPASMQKVSWSTETPATFSRQTANFKYCMWRTLSFNLGHEDALDWVWLQRLGIMLCWRAVGTSGGATYAQMCVSPKQFKLLFSTSDEQSVVPEALTYALQFCSPLRVFERFPKCKGPSDEAQSIKNPQKKLTFLLSNTSGCGQLTGWPRESEYTQRTKLAKEIRHSPQQEYEIEAIQSIVSATNVSATNVPDNGHVRVYWVGYAASTIEPRSGTFNKLIYANRSNFDQGKKITVGTVTTVRNSRVTKKRKRLESSVLANIESRVGFSDAMMHTVPATFGQDGRFNPLTTSNYTNGFKSTAAVFEYFQSGKTPLLRVHKLYIETPDKKVIAWGRCSHAEIEELRRKNQSFLKFRNPQPRGRKEPEPSSLASGSESGSSSSSASSSSSIFSNSSSNCSSSSSSASAELRS